MKIGDCCIIPGHVKIGMDCKVHDVLYNIIDIKEVGDKKLVKVQYSNIGSDYAGWFCIDRLVEINIYDHMPVSIYDNIIN